MQNSTTQPSLNLSGLLPRVLPQAMHALLEKSVATLLGLRRLERFHRRLPKFSGSEFARVALEKLGVAFDVDSREQFHVPASGKAIVVANHPFGGLEGLFMIRLLLCLRDDVRILANAHLARIPELARFVIPVDPVNGRRATRQNAAGLRQALRWVSGGGLLLVFPAGTVSHFDPATLRVCDPLWSANIARLIRLAQAPVVPVYFAGRNSWRFQLAGVIHPRLRTVLLARELFNKKALRVPVRIGRPIPYEKLRPLNNDDRLAAHLRMKTYLLAEVPMESRAAPSAAQGTVVAPQVHRAERIANPVPAQLIVDEVARLPAHQRLIGGGELHVYHASAVQAPWLLQEIGRQRELTFRAVGEGTGRSADIDIYDDYYEHLFVWNVARQELVGAYRIGHTDRICERFGARGLYTSTLFDYAPPLLKQLSPALELGRSFVRTEYQKSFSALLLLWKGIGEYVVRHPRYCILFGAVSISNDYAALSREMLVQYLKRHNAQTQLGRWVRPRRPFRSRYRLRSIAGELKLLDDIESISAAVSDIESDGKGVPVLLRQYLKLGGRLLGFNVDPQFAHAVDCLIMVDLRQTDPRALGRYMGRETAQAFFSLHRREEISQAG